MDDTRPDPAMVPIGRSGPQRIHGNVAQAIGVAIVSGRHRPGDVLPGEVEFARELKISRAAYREAVRTLAAKGLVESRPKTGTRVTQRARWNLLDPDVLAWMFQEEPDEAFVRSLFELRLVIEPAAAALAAVRAEPAEVAAMREALDRMAALGLQTPEGRAADQAFHHLILAATRNEPLVTLSTTIAAAVGWTTIFKQRRQPLPRDPIPEHRALLDAIAAGDADAARARMTELVEQALRDTEAAR